MDLNEAREITYSSKSEIRDPVKLFSDIYGDFWAGRELSGRWLSRFDPGAGLNQVAWMSFLRNF